MSPATPPNANALSCPAFVPSNCWFPLLSNTQKYPLRKIPTFDADIEIGMEGVAGFQVVAEFQSFSPLGPCAARKTVLAPPDRKLPRKVTLTFQISLFPT